MKPGRSIEELTARIAPYLEEPAAVDRLTQYFGQDGFFSGGSFERLWGGGDRPEVANRITEQDIVAVSMLGVDIPAHPALHFLSDPKGEIAELLAGIPLDEPMWQCDIEALMNREGPAISLWRLADKPRGMGPTRTSKLLARKRPHLLPVFDSYVGRVLGPADIHWQNVHRLVSDRATRSTLARIRKRAHVEDVSLLRVLDVAIWMKDLGDRQWAKDQARRSRKH